MNFKQHLGLAVKAIENSSNTQDDTTTSIQVYKPLNELTTSERIKDNTPVIIDGVTSISIYPKGVITPKGKVQMLQLFEAFGYKISPVVLDIIVEDMVQKELGDDSAVDIVKKYVKNDKYKKGDGSINMFELTGNHNLKCLTYTEMSSMCARDGVPYMANGEYRRLANGLYVSKAELQRNGLK